MTLEELLKKADERKARWGIKRASAYVSGFSGCLDGGVCPASLLGVSGDQWAKCLKDAEEAAVYANPAMVVKSTSDSDLPDGAVLGFDCIITSTRKDRDGDILESSGCTLDQKMPLLWQHLAIQPIGKFMGETRRSKNFVGGRFAIADTPLGRDAATLVKFGALRISHGFMPVEYEPLEDDKGNHTGYRIRKFDMHEASVVSIPSNVDATILSVETTKAFAKELDAIRTVYGRNSLETDAVKQWAKRFYENRPVQGKGLDEQTVKVVVKVELDKPEEPSATKQACTCQGNDALAGKDAGGTKDGATDSLKSLTTKMYGEYYLSGSFEAIQSALHRSIRRHMLASGGDCCCEHDYCYLVATYPDSAIVCVDGYPHGDYYRVAYEMQGDEATWVGPPVEVEIELSASVTEDAKSRAAAFDRSKTPVEQKCFAELMKNHDRMRAFRDRIDAVLEAGTPQEWADVDALDELLSALA